MFHPPPFNPDEPCETLAENTSEALRVVRQGEWVYKFLKQPEAVPFANPDSRELELVNRVRESQRQPELNSMWFLSEQNCIVSRYVGGRSATREEASALLDSFAASGRGYIKDCCRTNIRIVEGRRVVLDFAISEANRDWSRPN